MKRVLFINSVCGSGSTGKIVLELYHTLEKADYKCKIAYGRNTAPENIETIKIGSKINVYCHGLLSRITDRHGFYSTLATKRFLKKLDNYQPDIVHLHNIHGYYINIKILFEYLSRRKIPVIWTLHDCWPFTGHCAYFNTANCQKWRTECTNCPQKSAYPASYILDSSSWNFETKKKLFTSLVFLTIVVPSNWMKDRVKESFLSSYSIKVIKNGIDLSVFKPTANDIKKRYSIENKSIILGVANTWEPRKGLNYFIELSKMLDSSFQIILVGLSAKQIKHLPPQIIGLQRVDNIKSLVELYSAADLLFNSSKEETMGMVTVEALACGTPVMAFNCTAIPEMFDKTCGILLYEDSIKYIYDTIQKGDWKRITPISCQAYAKRFSKNEKYREYKSLYDSILSNQFTNN